MTYVYSKSTASLTTFIFQEVCNLISFATYFWKMIYSLYTIYKVGFSSLSINLLLFIFLDDYCNIFKRGVGNVSISGFFGEYSDGWLKEL